MISTGSSSSCVRSRAHRAPRTTRAKQALSHCSWFSGIDVHTALTKHTEDYSVTNEHLDELR